MARFLTLFKVIWKSCFSITLRISLILFSAFSMFVSLGLELINSCSIISFSSSEFNFSTCTSKVSYPLLIRSIFKTPVKTRLIATTSRTPRTTAKRGNNRFLPCACAEPRSSLYLSSEGLWPEVRPAFPVALRSWEPSLFSFKASDIISKSPWLISSVFFSLCSLSSTEVFSQLNIS